MLGFGKKKKKEKEKAANGLPTDPADNKAGDKNATEEKSDGEDAPVKAPVPKRKKRFSIKLILVTLLVLVAIGGSGFVVYLFYFSPKSDSGTSAAYQKNVLEHINLPDEMLKFSFKYFPDLYAAMVTYNAEITLIDKEILRIESISQTYPEQKKIADKEKKVWEKAKGNLQKSFLKIEKPVKETYVLFRVNQASGLTQIEIKYPELVEVAVASLAPAQELTVKLKTTEIIPQGLIKGNLYKLKKKFL